MEQELWANECVDFYLKWGAHRFHQFPEGLRPVGSSEPLVGQHGHSGPPGWRRLGTQAGGGVVRHWVCPVPSVLPLVKAMVGPWPAAPGSFPLKAKL